VDTESLEHSDLLRLVVPTEKRRKGLVGAHEEYLTEGAVMLAYALHLRSAFDANRIELHPDGEHGKIFDFRNQLGAFGYQFVSPLGSTNYGGVYRHVDQTEIAVHPKAGLGDVVAYFPRGKIVAETKGGIVNTTHPGPTSRMRRGLCEAVGLLLATPVEEGTRQVAVVPNVAVTQQLARKMVHRVRAAGISIALVDRTGNVTDII
jgi:hypothetical protein